MSALATTRAGAGKLEVWNTVAEITELRGGTKRGNREWVKAQALARRKRNAKSINGKEPWEYRLPIELAFKKANAELALVAKPDEGSAPQLRLLSDLDPEELKEYETRVAAIMPLIEARNEGGSVTKAVEIGCKAAGVSKEFVWKYWMKYLDGGLAALIPPKHNKKFGTRTCTMNDERVQQFVIYKYTVERIPNVSLIHEALVREWKTLGVAGDPPSRGTVNTVVYGDRTRGIPSAIPAPAKTLAHKGPRAWAAQNGPVIQRQRPKPGAWFVADTRTLDVACRNTLFPTPTLQREEMFRLDCVALVDWGSFAWVGCCLGPQGSSRLIFSALRMAILDYGLPGNLLSDRGKDYAAAVRKLQGKDDEFGERMNSMLRANGVTFGLTRALPYNAQAKMVESMFSGMSDRFDPIWGVAYMGSSSARRSEYNAAAQKQHKAYLEGKAAKSPLPADAEVIAGAVKWMENENNRPRRELGGRTPLQALEEQWPAASRKPVDRRLLDVLFCERDERKIQRGGCVQLDNRRYEPKDEYLAALDLRQGQQVIVLRDPYCLEEAVALDSETFDVIGELRLQDFVPQSPNGHLSRDQIAAAIRRKSSLRRMYTGYLAFHAAIARTEGWKTEREVLLEEVAVTATGTDGRALPPGAAPGAIEPHKISAPSQRTALAPFCPGDVRLDLPDQLPLEGE